MSTFPHALEDRFRPVRLLGAGGYGAVWLVVQKELDREVALKLLHGHALDQAELVGRFLAEARVTAALVHPNIVILVDHNVDDGLPWIAYEYLPGPPLSSRILQGKLTHDEALTAGLHVARALEVAHGRGVLHRDVKPDNVIADGRGGWKVTDFGIARWVSGTVRTASGVVMGTPPYMAPEMFLGETPTAAVDLYALGVLLFEALTGRLPYSSESVTELAEAHLRAPVPRVPDVPPRLERLVRQALAKHPSERPASAGAMAAELEAILGGEGLSKGQVQRRRAVSTTTKVVPVSPRRPRWPAVLVVVALALTSAFIRRPAPAPPAAPRVAQVDAAVDRLIQKLKDAEGPRISLDGDRVRSGTATAGPVATELAAVASQLRELADVESSFDPSKFDPPRRAHVAFRLAACRWSLACWRRRLETHADAFDAERAAWTRLEEALLALPAALAAGGVGGDRGWLIHVAANDVAFLARHFAYGAPCRLPAGGVLAGLEAPAAGHVDLVRRLLRAEVRIGLDPQRELDAGELTALHDAMTALTPDLEPPIRAEMKLRAFHAAERAHGRLVALAVPRPEQFRALIREQKTLDARSIQALEDQRATAALARSWSATLPTDTFRSRGRSLEMRAAALVLMLDAMRAWLHRATDSEVDNSLKLFLATIGPYVASVDEGPPYQTESLPNLLWELRMLGSGLAGITGGPDPRLTAAVATARKATGGMRGSVHAALIATYLDHGNDGERSPTIAEHTALLRDLRAAFDHVPDVARQRELLMRDLCARAQGSLEPYLEVGPNLVGAIDRIRTSENGAGAAAVAPFLEDEMRALALSDGLLEELARRPTAHPQLNAAVAHMAAIAFTVWLRSGRLRILKERTDFEFLATANAQVAMRVLPPPGWSSTGRRLTRHMTAIRPLLAGSRVHSDERETALCGAARDMFAMAREMRSGEYRLAHELPPDLARESRELLRSAPDADPALVELFDALFEVAWQSPHDVKRRGRAMAAMARASRWAKLVSHSRTCFDAR